MTETQAKGMVICSIGVVVLLVIGLAVKPEIVYEAFENLFNALSAISRS